MSEARDYVAKVYLETSFISMCVCNRTDAGSIYRKAESLEWWQKYRKYYSLYVSDEVLAELSDPIYPLSIEALTFAQETENLTVNAEVIGFAQILVTERVMPGPAQSGDAVHVAAATIHGVDYILSWNVKHLANPNKIMHLRNICLKLGMIPPRIVTPDLLWGGADEQES